MSTKAAEMLTSWPRETSSCTLKSRAALPVTAPESPSGSSSRRASMRSASSVMRSESPTVAFTTTLVV